MDTFETRGSRESPGSEVGAPGSRPSSAPEVHVTLGKSGPLLASVFLVSKMVIITFALPLSCGYPSDQSIS